MGSERAQTPLSAAQPELTALTATSLPTWPRPGRRPVPAAFLRSRIIPFVLHAAPVLASEVNPVFLTSPTALGTDLWVVS